MDGQLGLGSAIIIATVIIHAVCFEGLIRFLNRFSPRMASFHNMLADIAIIVFTVLAIFAIHTVDIWLWAAVYFLLGEFTHLNEALYFSTVTFTTLGYGDITLTERWQILSGLEAVNGILMFGWSTAFLFAVLTRIWQRKGLISSADP